MSKRTQSVVRAVKPEIKAAAIPRAGYEYQDLVGIEVLLRHYRDPGLFNWVKLEADDSQFKALDDVVAERVDGSYEFVQVKFTVDSERYELDWPWLLEKSGKGTSMLAKWATSFARVAAKGRIHSACLKTNRPPSAEFRKGLVGTRVSLAMLDPALRRSIEEECGGQAEAELFLSSFDFLSEQPDFQDYERRLRDGVVPADTDPLGWVYFRHHVRTWATNKNQPSPDGKILREHVIQVINRRRPQPLRQDFAVPDGYQPPSGIFYEAIRARLQGENATTVLWGTPGRGKSTFLSHLTLKLQQEGAAVLRHHYFIPADEGFSDRTSFSDIAASLLEQLGARHAEAMGGVSDSATDFRRSITVAASNLAKEAKRLYIVIDGLDHVWRDSRRVDQLNHLFNELLPPPENVSVIVGTQRVPDEQLPSKLLTLARDEDWHEIPAMEQAAVHGWVAHMDEARPLLLRFDTDPDRRAELVSEVADALFRISQGHPLHLIYAHEQLVRVGLPISADDVNALDPCPDGDIRTYYQGLWVRLSSTAKNALHLLAGSGFHWPSLGIRQVLGDFSEIDHLLEPRRFGMVPFHSSVFAWVRERPDHIESYVALLPKIVDWLEKGAPEYWRWGWLWLTKARAGDFAELLAGTNREWVVSSLSSGWPPEQIESILKSAEEKCFLDGDLPGAVERRSLKTRVSNGRNYQARDFSLFLATALAVSKNFQQTLNLIDAPFELSDEDVGAIGTCGPSELVSETQSACLSELGRRINTWISLRHRPHGEFTKLIDQLIAVSAQMGDADVDRVLSFLLGFGEPDAYVAKMIRSLGNAQNLPGLKVALTKLQGDDWGEPRIRVHDEIVRICGLKGADARQLIQGENNFISPFAAYWFLSRGFDPPSDVRYADVPAGLIQGRYAYGMREDVVGFFWDSFWSALYVAMRAGGAPYTLIPLDLGDGAGWIKVGLVQLEKIAASIAVGELEADFSAVYMGSADVAAMTHGPSPEEDYTHYIAYCEALRRIALDLHLATSSGARVSGSALEAARGSVHWSDEIWVARSSVSRVPVVEPESAKSILEDEASRLTSMVVEFSERSERWTLLAHVAKLYEDPGQQSYLRHAAECVVGYGWRKDLSAIEVLDAISWVHSKDPSNTRRWLEAAAPIVDQITEFTDGDETDHVKSELIDVVNKRLSEFLPSLLDHHVDEDEHRFADECVIEHVGCMNLSLDESRALAGTLIDASTLGALEKRAREDGVARQLVDKQLAFLGGRPPRNGYESPDPDSEDEGVEPPDVALFGPDCFADVIAASETVDYKRRGGFLASWLNHCRQARTATQALHSIWSYFETCQLAYGADEVLDEAFRVSLEVEGKDAAYPWLVRAHVHRNGWQSWFTSEEEAMGRLELAAANYSDRWLSYIRDTSVPAPYYRKRGDGLIIGRKYLVRFLILAGQVEVASAVADVFVRTLAEEVRDQPIPPASWFKPNSSGVSTGLGMLFTRLKWPVPMVRFLVAREARALLDNVVTRPSATATLLEHLERCRYESETCEVLNLLMLASDGARPPHVDVACRIKHPSILADLLLKKAFGEGGEVGRWRETCSQVFPPDFEPISYFNEYKTSHVPPVYCNHLLELERQSGFDFQVQWAFEWSSICDSAGTRYTRYPYYFGDFSKFREGIIGQFWQRMREAYLSAYLRTLAFAVAELNLPQAFAESLCLGMVYGIHGLHELTPTQRPGWLGEFPEEALASGDELETVVREFIRAIEFDGMRITSLRTPLRSSVDEYAILDMSSHLVTSDYEPGVDQQLYEMRRVLPDENLMLEGVLPALPLHSIESDGKIGSEFSVCVELMPLPFGSWQSDVIGVGLPFPEPLVASGHIRCTTDAIELTDSSGVAIGRTITWNDHWKVLYPRQGRTRCGVAAFLSSAALEDAQERTKRKLAWFIAITTWRREKDQEAYTPQRRSAFFMDV